LLSRWSLRRRKLPSLPDLVFSLLPDSNEIHLRYVLGLWIFIVGECLVLSRVGLASPVG